MVEKDYTKVVAVALSFIGIFALILIGTGITGKIIYDNYSVKDLCSSDLECRQNEVCCLFYQDTSGVCHEKQMCERITEITKNEKITSESLSNLVIEKPNNQINSNLMLIGAGVLLIIIIILYILTRSVLKDEKEYEKGLNKKLKATEKKINNKKK